LIANVSSGEVCASLTVCGMVPAWVQVTVPPGPTVTSAGVNAGVGASTMATAAVAGPPGTTRTTPFIGWSRHT
jgi:hypothetical protein